MARTLSVHDDSTGITASMTIDETGDKPRRTEIRFTADGDASVTANDLRLVESFGLTLPTGSPALPMIPATDPVPPAVHCPAPAKKTRQGTSRFDGKKPTDKELLRLWQDTGGIKSEIARKVGCHPTTVGTWVAEAEARGVDFPGKP